jgi:hypothetical protein
LKILNKEGGRLVKEELRDKYYTFLNRLKCLRHPKDKVQLCLLVIFMLLNKYIFLFSLSAIIINVQSKLENRKKIVLNLISAGFILSMSVFFLEIKNNLFTYWFLFSVLFSKYLLHFLRKFFKDNNIFPFGCLIVYAIINTPIMIIIFKNIKFIPSVIMNILMSVAIFMEKKLLDINHEIKEHFLLKKMTTYMIPSFIVCLFYLFKIIEL